MYRQNFQGQDLRVYRDLQVPTLLNICDHITTWFDTVQYFFRSWNSIDNEFNKLNLKVRAR